MLRKYRGNFPVKRESIVMMKKYDQAISPI